MVLQNNNHGMQVTPCSTSSTWHVHSKPSHLQALQHTTVEIVMAGPSSGDITASLAVRAWQLETVTV